MLFMLPHYILSDLLDRVAEILEITSPPTSCTAAHFRCLITNTSNFPPTVKTALPPLSYSCTPTLKNVNIQAASKFTIFVKPS